MKEEMIYKSSLYEVEIRINNDEEPLFMLNDLCLALNLKNTTMSKKYIFPEYQRKAKFKAGNKTITANAVTEAGMYQLIMSSRKEEAIKFQKYIFEDVIPKIRKEQFYFNLEQKETTILGKSFARVMASR
jgi:prophage antirepressor-like protein